jgi:GMP synthase-like glutamine amidotransferase
MYFSLFLHQIHINHSMKINILLCDEFDGLLTTEILSYWSLFQSMFDRVNKTVRYEIFNVQQGIYPETLNRGELYLVPGSRAGAYDDTPWVKELTAFIRRMYAEGVKILGVCFGHQVIAQALGGKVIPAPQGWGAGIRTSKVIDAKALAYFPQKTMSLHYNHHDQVVQLPPGAVCFAQSDFCPIDGFYIGNQVLTFQGHPEYTIEYSRYLLLNDADNEPAEVVSKALASLDIPVDSQAAARWMLNNG